MNLPRVVFSKWTRWGERTRLNGIQNPGVYALARFTKPPRGPVELRARNIIYFGETCGNSLRGRWRAFHRSAFEGNRGHSGGRTYRRRFGGKGMRGLYVAAFPVEGLTKELRALFIRYIERKVILEYASKWGVAPKCNRK